LNGDPLARAEDGNPVRWRVATSTWEHLGNPLNGGVKTAQFAPRTEDAAGTIYSDASMLTAGSRDWVPTTFPGQSTSLQRPWGNGKGDLVVQGTGGGKAVLYRKPAGSTTFTLASERPADKMVVIGLSDGGDVFLFPAGGDPPPTPLVLPNGKSDVVPVLDCKAPNHDACGLGVLVNPRGDVLFYGGGLGTRHMYRLDATATYPGTAKPLYDFPDGACCFNGGQALLADGTLLARMNDGANGDYMLYVHKPGAGAWSDPVLLPGEDTLHSVDIFATVNGAVFTNNIVLGDVYGGGPAYRVGY
jgi:hypothetical protein